MILGKTLLLCSLSMLTAFLFVVIKSSAKIYLILAAALIFEFSCFIFIDGSSVLASLKFINIFYLISGNNIFGCYQNVNIFSQPINIITVFIGLAVALSVVGILGAALAFSRLSQHNGKLVLLDRLMSRLGRFKKINGSVRIYSGEAYKHYKTSFALVAVIILVALGFVSYNDDLSIIFRSPQESAYDTYMQTLEGELDEEKYDFIESERAYFDELTREAEELSADNTISVEEKTNRLNTIDGILSIRGMAFEDICAQLEYVNEKAELTGEKPALVNEVVNKRLTMDTFREWEYFALLLAVVIFCTSNILAIEYKTSMVNLISANKHGKARLLIIKLLTVLITTVISYILIYLPYMLNFIKTFGTASFDLPLAYSRDFSALTSGITVGGYILALGFVHLLAAVGATALVYLLSYIFKNQFVTMIISSGLLLIPCVVFIDNSKIRMVSAFSNNAQTAVIGIITAVCLLIIAVSALIIFVPKRKSTKFII